MLQFLAGAVFTPVPLSIGMQAGVAAALLTMAVSRLYAGRGHQLGKMERASRPSR